MKKPLYQKIQDQLNRYSNTRFSSHAVADVLCTVAEGIVKDHPGAARAIILEADIAQQPPEDSGIG